MGSASADDDRRRPHVALVAFPFGTHAAPLLALARALASSRSGAAAAATFSFLGTARSLASLRGGCDQVPDLRVVAIPEGGEGEGDGEEEEMRQIGRFAAAAEAGGIREGLRAAAAAAAAEVSCVVSDAFVWAAGDAAEEIGAPWVPLWTGGPHSLATHLRGDLLRSTFGLGPQAMEDHGDDPLDFVPGLSGHHRVRDLPEGIIFGPLDDPIAVILSCMADRLLRRPPTAAALVLNTFLGFDPTADAAFASEFDHYLPVGPLHLLADPPHPLADPDPSNCLSWLDQHPPASAAYVGFGTVAMPPPAELAALAKGLELSRAPFVWSLKESAQELLPPGFSDRVRANGTGLVVSWAPQKAVLGHAVVGAFVSHCGWNSVLESVAAGVPMVCRPIFGDQRMNARAVESVWGIGVALRGGIAAEEVVAGALDVVLRGEEGRRMRERAREIKAKAAAATGVGGSSSENLKKLLKLVCG
ncbi:anthocyanidin 3-O-glucosyltransferase 7-like [Ananas comosus]|uniref:Glycosyltransferase n=1 Tax=Ananas comosus TaxID=4615 RepID=A0A6P5GJI0_ANACO|nr:anthocyanidin 3-O-glucosyltransferase 7-like [Ananas comosus]